MDDTGLTDELRRLSHVLAVEDAREQSQRRLASLVSVMAAAATLGGTPVNLVSPRAAICENCNRPRSAEANHCTRCGHWRRRV